MLESRIRAKMLSVPAQKQALLLSHNRPDKSCFEQSIYRYGTTTDYTHDCYNQWKEFDRDCVDKWNKKCEEAYDDFSDPFSTVLKRYQDEFLPNKDPMQIQRHQEELKMTQSLAQTPQTKSKLVEPYKNS